MNRRVTGSSAATSEATKLSSLPDADDHRTALARENDALRVVLAHHGQRIGAFELRHRGAHGLEQILHRLQMMMDAMRDDFGVGLGAELVARALQLGAQLFVVLDDAVVHDGQAVAGDVRMGVALARHAMRGPARVGDAHGSVNGRLIQRLLQHLHLAQGAQAGQVPGAVEHGEAGRVVAPVLQAPQAFHQHRDDISPGDGPNDSAHM